MGKWVKKKLGEIGDIITGSTPTTSKLDYWNGDYNFYSPADFTDNIYCDKTERTVTIEGLNVGRCIPENSIMVACIASIGKIAINKTMGITNQQINSIIPFDEFNYLFLYYLLLHKSSAIKNGAAQTTIPIINKEDFSNLEVTIPSSLSEQRRIASILSSADKVIDSTQKLIAKYKQIKQGMMEDLLKPKEGWKKVKFDNFFEMLPNNTLSREDLNSQGGSFQNIHYGDVLIKYPYCLDCNIHEIPYINRDVKFNSTKAIDGDVIFADTAEDDTVGKCVELINVGDRKIVSGLHTYLCRPKFKMSVGYLGYFLNSNVYHNQLLPYIAGSKVSSVNRKSIAQTYICFPDLSEQCRIASILSGIDKKIESEEKVLEKYKKIKKGLMEKLLNCENNCLL
ncbi:MAG: restriction endonuclease subunit S [Paludibacteraceae bacterium]|nr:restriction endonuclease subunit S [Paludibacteraceae bacterium]